MPDPEEGHAVENRCHDMGYARTMPTGQWSEPRTCGMISAEVTRFMNGVETPK